MSKNFSKTVEDNIHQYVLNDLDPSWMQVHMKVAIAAIIGGLVSLLICGQFGLGFTPIATVFNHMIHESMGPVPCAILCGTLYAIFPVAILRFGLCGPLQFRAITKRRWQAIVVWFGGFGAAMAHFGHHGNNIVTFAGWVTAAVVAANLIAHVLYSIIPSWDSSLRLRFLDHAR
jgi:hypothetical protein